MLFMRQVRKIKPTTRSVSGQFAYRGIPIEYESTLERDFLVYQTFRNNVIDVVAQPCKIEFKKNGRTYNYTPDYFVQVKDDCSKSFIAEVKPKAEWQKHWRDWSEKWKAAIRYCNEREFKFIIFDEDRIRHQAFNNINFLMRYRNLHVIDAEVDAIINEVEQRGHTTVKFLLERYFASEMYRTHGKRVIWHLLANKKIGCDIWGDIKNEHMEVWCGY